MKNIFYLFLLGALVFTGCTTDDLDPSLEQNKNVEGGIATVGNVYGLLKGAYNRMTVSAYYGRDYIVNGEVRTPNTFSNGNSGRFVTQASLEYNANSGYMWDDVYRVLSVANVIINVDVDALTGDKDLVKEYQGQAYVMRALAHFDLLKEYGQQNAGGQLGVPIVTTFLSGASSDEELFKSRSTVDEVKAQIYADLNTGFEMLTNTSDKVFFSKYSAKALESRVAIYFAEWQRAADAAKVVIDNGGYSILPADQFVASWGSKQSANSIFELAFSATDNNGINGLAYIYRGNTYGDVQVVNEVVDLFGAEDVRGMGGILGMEGDLLRNMGKFPNNQGNNNIPLIRYEEVVLNYAEALFELENFEDALVELNMIPLNRGAAQYTEVTKENILAERRKEFMFEGFYFHDLMRTGSAIEKLYAQQNIAETIPYGDYRLAWPIPLAEMDANSNMVQNTGY